MNKEMIQLLDSINAKKIEFENLVNADKLEEAKNAKEELVKLQDKFNLLKDMENVVVPTVKVAEPKNAVAQFADAARHGFKNLAQEGVSADGGYTVPADIQTRINELREAKASLIDLVTVENVSTLSGARTYKTRSTQTGFTKVGEKAAIGAKNTPTFSRIEYTIEKYAGYYPVTNELLADSDANITNVLTQWIADESRVTRNKLILTAITPSSKTALSGLDDIKEALNVTLGQAFKATSTIITNDDGLQYLDTLKDSNGNYLLNPDPTQPARMFLRAGATAVPVFVLPNAELASTSASGTTKIPFIIGDLKEGVRFFDRNSVSIMSSNVASVTDYNAFEDDMTLFRAIEREDVVVVDSAAYVYGEISVSAAG